MSQLDERLWQDWSETWRADGPVEDAEEAVRRAVDRQTRAMRLALAGEVAVTVATFAVVAWVWLAEREAARVGWILAALLHTAILWTFGLWNRRGIWRPLGRSTLDYLAVARVRLDRRRQAANFVLLFLAVEIVLLIVWLATRTEPAASGPGTDLATRPPLGWWPAGAVSIGAIWWAIRQHRGAREELARLAKLDRQLVAEGTGG